MIWLYRLLFPFAMVVALPHYVRRMRKRGGYAANFSHRFGKTPALPERRAGVKRIWLQAVSVGELLAIEPLIEELRVGDAVEIYLSTTTSTGFKLAVEKYSSSTIGIGYFPVDFLFFSARAWNRIRPDVAVLMEGERWPEHLRQARSRHVPVLAINARLSDRSFKRMRRFRKFLPSLFGAPDRILACSATDARRFKELGFPVESIRTTGSIKLDLTIEEMNAMQKQLLRDELGISAGMILLGSSTWPGEEEALLSVFEAARSVQPDLALLIVPRHAERRTEIRSLMEKSNWKFHFRSEGPATKVVEVAIADTTGELRRLTQLADVTFVGKSLPPHTEGQTPVEAAALGKPILFGPKMSNFKEIARSLVEEGAAKRVADVDQLKAEIVTIISERSAREEMSAAAMRWHRANQGATARTVMEIRQILGDC